MDTVNQEGPATRAEAITVIFTNLFTRGSGKGAHDPVRRVEQFWTEDGRLVAENDEFSYSDYFRDQVFDVLGTNESVLVEHLGVSFSVENPSSWLIDIIDRVNALADKVKELHEENARLVAILNQKDTTGVELEPEFADTPFELMQEEEEDPLVDKYIFALSRGDDSKDEIVAVFKRPDQEEDPGVGDRLWGVVRSVVRTALEEGENPDPDRYNIPDLKVGGELQFKTLYGYVGHFKGDAIDSVSPITFSEDL